MRMSCNSTYLLDKETDHGHKADELATLLEEVLEDRDAKAVIFSQWLRMHELIVRRLAKHGFGHVLFHGGVPGPKRKDLLARFREDTDCRLFLSTDAGGVGLNLQHASMVANMDLPWNPAVLEQRIGRVHRLGQHRPVRVVNFIAKGTIEESMLGLLKFKKSMFAGVLDGGKSEVFLGGTRLKQFMDSVEKATTTIPNPMPADSIKDENGDGASVVAGSSQETNSADADERESAPATIPIGLPERTAAGAPAEGQIHLPPRALGDLLAAGAAFLNQLGQSLRQADAGNSIGAGSPGPDRLIGRDETTGRTYLKLPIPQGDAMQSLVNLLQTFAKNSP
jgi:superfamily II DNA/RNA helicase